MNAYVYKFLKAYNAILVSRYEINNNNNRKTNIACFIAFLSPLKC